MRIGRLYSVAFFLSFQAHAATAPPVDRPTAQIVVSQGAPGTLSTGMVSTPVLVPVPGLTAWTRSTDGATWIGTRGGLLRLDGTGQRFFASRRYLPDNHIEAIWPDQQAGVWARTPGGVAHLQLKPMTLEEKADFFEARVRARHDRHGLVADSRLKRAGDLATNQLASNDNDGLWTAMYAAGKLFEYAVRPRPAALAAARKSIEAILRLESVTGVSGFPARSWIAAGEPQPGDGEWHDMPGGRWKGDASSDEIVGHFFIFGLAWDLLPAGDPLKPRVAATARRMMDHIIEHQYTLVDTDGKPTRWGWWNWEYFRGRGVSDGPLNALEVLSFLKTAEHVTGDAKYGREYRRMALDEGYLAHAAKYLELREEINYSDEELAMLPFYLVFRYERDEALLKGYRQALEQWWQNARRERNPLWHFIYQTANPSASVDLAEARETLARIPLDLVQWSYDNSRRADVELDPALDRFRRPQSRNWLPPDERAVMKWNGNPFRLDGGNGGMGEDDGGFFVLPYWLGRYHRFIGPPASR
ncbi:MAG: hypothetical protein K2X03_17920 [Bryobacteraceae bacterium]|nr:hypothetical protein [Bryobacteraceae bacterium]